jgi:hypothetical protein
MPNKALPLTASLTADLALISSRRCTGAQSRSLEGGQLSFGVRRLYATSPEDPMNRFTICFAALVFAGSFQARGEDVRVTLDKAITEYEQSLSKYQDRANKYFDTREAAARKKGNKWLVDQIKDERDTFEISGELPPTALATLRAHPLNALTTLTAAYTQAVKEYTRTGQDALSDGLTC